MSFLCTEHKPIRIAHMISYSLARMKQSELCSALEKQSAQHKPGEKRFAVSKHSTYRTVNLSRIQLQHEKREKTTRIEQQHTCYAIECQA